MASLSRIDSLNKILELEKYTNNKIKVGTALTHLTKMLLINLMKT